MFYINISSSASVPLQTSPSVKSTQTLTIKQTYGLNLSDPV